MNQTNFQNLVTEIRTHDENGGIGLLLIEFVSRVLARRRAERELDELDDRLLADLGILRCDIPQAVRAGRRSHLD
jgi:uncharacterized protein YjiS (DUF1127 family)